MQVLVKLPYIQFSYIFILFYLYICDPSGEKGPSGGQLSKLIFSHKLVNKLLNDTFINFISS